MFEALSGPKAARPQNKYVESLTTSFLLRLTIGIYMK